MDQWSVFTFASIVARRIKKINERKARGPKKSPRQPPHAGQLFRLDRRKAEAVNHSPIEGIKKMADEKKKKDLEEEDVYDTDEQPTAEVVSTVDGETPGPGKEPPPPPPPPNPGE
jgi:hypothetical protein